MATTTTKDGLTIETHRKARGRISALYLVKDQGQVIGILERYRNTRTETHPWKAFRGFGMGAEFLGAFYDARDFAGRPSTTLGDYNFGGKAAALAAINRAATFVEVAPVIATPLRAPAASVFALRSAPAMAARLF